MEGVRGTVDLTCHPLTKNNFPEYNTVKVVNYRNMLRKIDYV